MLEEIRIGRLMPDEIDDERAKSIRDIWLRAGNLIGEGQTNPDLTRAVCDINSPTIYGVRCVGGILEFM